MIRTAFLLVFIALCTCTPLWAQYHLDEFGFRAGMGTNVPTFAGGNLMPSFAYNMHAFYSHYRCGKRDGYHIELGFRGYQVFERKTQTPNYYYGGEEDGNVDYRETKGVYNMGYFDIGGYYKFRMHRHHKRRETAFFVGPRLNIRTFSLVKPEGESTEKYKNTSYRKINNFVPGVNVSVWQRIPIGHTKSIQIIFGAEYYVLSAVNNDTYYKKLWYNSLHLFINVGMTFWKNA